MIAYAFIYPHVLLYGKSLVCKNIINSKCRGNMGKGSANSTSFLRKTILQPFANCRVGIAIGHIIKISTDYYRVRALIDLLFNVLTLVFTF